MLISGPSKVVVPIVGWAESTVINEND